MKRTEDEGHVGVGVCIGLNVASCVRLSTFFKEKNHAIYEHEHEQGCGDEVCEAFPESQREKLR